MYIANKSRYWAFILCLTVCVLSLPSLYAGEKSNATGVYPAKGLNCNVIKFYKHISRVLKSDHDEQVGSILIAKPKNHCEFYQRSWEIFTWATKIGESGKPKFLELKSASDVHGDPSRKKILTLATRRHVEGGTLGAGSIVEADGNMVVGKNGYPIYAAVHMNDSYFNVVQKNLIKNNYQPNGYVKSQLNGKPYNEEKEGFIYPNYFKVGDMVFKSTWMRFDDISEAPAGAYITQAQVPVLEKLASSVDGKNKVTVKLDNNEPVTETVKVALVGLHVVPFVTGHPEFLWATFEHADNSPRVVNHQFTSTINDAKNYTFYKAKTPFNKVNQPTSGQNGKPVLSFHEKTQKFSPATNVVQMNKFGGASIQDQLYIKSLNLLAEQFYRSQEGRDYPFSHYQLIGTTWFKATGSGGNVNWKTQDQKDAQGSINLANSTAETFVQAGGNHRKNCFSCHNASSFSYQANPLPKRRVAITHLLSIGSSYDIPNEVFVK